MSISIRSYEKRLKEKGIDLSRLPFMEDCEILRVGGIGKVGLAFLRENYPQGVAVPIKPQTLEEQVAEALTPVLSKRRDMGPKTIRALARMVAAYCSD